MQKVHMHTHTHTHTQHTQSPMPTCIDTCTYTHLQEDTHTYTHTHTHTQTERRRAADGEQKKEGEEKFNTHTHTHTHTHTQTQNTDPIETCKAEQYRFKFAHGVIYLAIQQHRPDFDVFRLEALGPRVLLQHPLHLQRSLGCDNPRVTSLGYITLTAEPQL